MPPTNAPPRNREVDLAAPTSPDAPVMTSVLSPAQALLEELLRRSLILEEEWASLPADIREPLLQETLTDRLLLKLVDCDLLTAYQGERIKQGGWGGLRLGNYRVLEPLGAGGMGMVFRGEHLLMRHIVAIKILASSSADSNTLARFLSEIRHVTELHHPNLVAALDAGKTPPTEWDNPNWYFLVMEYVPGSDLEKLVKTQGPMAPAKACELICQVASGLAEAHKHELIHRDVKPSNILVTPEGQPKLTDFGLARTFQDRRLTKPGMVVGSIDYIAPEQAYDSAAIDHRADIYALGATLFWCLTGKPPFAPQGNVFQDLSIRQTPTPPQVRSLRPEVPAEFSDVVSRMMALRPQDRYPSAQSVIQALLPFLQPTSSPHLARFTPASVLEMALPAGVSAPTGTRTQKLLIVDDSATFRAVTLEILQQEGLSCDEASDGPTALRAIRSGCYDLVLLDIQMPNVGGDEVLRALRAEPPAPNLKILMMSGEVDPDAMAAFLAAGADDYLPKSTSAVQLVARVKAALAHKDAQDRSDMLNRNLLALNAELERNLSAKASDLVYARNGLVLAFAELAELRTHHGTAHLLRLQRYVRLLAEEAAREPAFAGQIDAAFIDMLEACAPLHDIGQMALPDHILQKAGKLDVEERLIVQTHTTLGADILQNIAQRHRTALGFLQMAIDIARHHHEAYDGSGYPDRRAGTGIPLAARIVTIADVYDALRSRRPHRPPLSHGLALELMNGNMPTRFDPHLAAIFHRHADRFAEINRATPDN